jgi:hypothetical protein
MLWCVDAEDSSIKELAGSGNFHPVNLLWLDGGSSLKEVSLGFFFTHSVVLLVAVLEVHPSCSGFGVLTSIDALMGGCWKFIQNGTNFGWDFFIE